MKNYEDISNFIYSKDFPSNCIGKLIRHKEIYGKVIKVSPSKKYFFIELKNGDEKNFLLTQLKKFILHIVC